MGDSLESRHSAAGNSSEWVTQKPSVPGRPAWLAIVATLLYIFSGTSHAQLAREVLREQAAATNLMIVQGVQQAIGSLPPTSGQSIVWDFAAGGEAPVRSEYLGPTSLRATEVVAEGYFSIRAAASYFELTDRFEAIAYAIEFEDPSIPSGFVKFGSQATATVGMLNLAASYGLTTKLEATLNLPIVVVDASAATIFTTRTSTLALPASEAPLSGTPRLADLDPALKRGQLTLRKESFADLGLNAFEDGTHIGIGRISVGAKAVLYADTHVQLAMAPEFFFPSPNEDEFAGAASAAFLPRVVAAVPLWRATRLRADIGYDYDFEEAALRRLVWSAGVSVPFRHLTFDTGIGGSQYDQSIDWTPTRARFAGGSFTVLGDNRLGDSFLDFLGGIKLGLTDTWALSGAVAVPLNDEGFRPAALGTLALEYTF